MDKRLHPARRLLRFPARAAVESDAGIQYQHFRSLPRIPGMEDALRVSFLHQPADHRDHPVQQSLLHFLVHQGVLRLMHLLQHFMPDG